MAVIQQVEQFIPFIKPLFDGLRSIRDFIKRDPRKKLEHSIEIPKKTLILLPGSRPNSVVWSAGKSNNVEGVQISGHLQATNTSDYHIKIALAKLITPSGGEVITHMALVKDPKSGMYSAEHLLEKGSIGEVHFMFFVVPVPVVAQQSKSLSAKISLIDQFGNAHDIAIECKFVG